MSPIQRQPQGYYAASAGTPKRRAPLEGPVSADVCVIGAGYTGLSAALHAAQAGARVSLVEAETVGFAASGRNGGQINTGLGKGQGRPGAWLGLTHAPWLWLPTREQKTPGLDHIEYNRTVVA